MQIYASPPIFIIIQRRNYKEKQFFSKFLAGVELAISESAVQCLIHWATAGSVNLLLQKLIFNCQASSQDPRIFSRWQPLFRASSKCLCISQFQLHPSPPPPPPGNCGAFARIVSPGGRALAYPRVTPRLLTHTWFLTRNPNEDNVIGKDQ